MNNTLFEYWLMFDEMPSQLKLVSYDNEFYIRLMKKAIERGTPITDIELDMAISDQKYDMVQPTRKEILEEKYKKGTK